MIRGSNRALERSEGQPSLVGASGGAKRIGPPQAGESREVGVARVEFGTVLDRKGREVPIRHQVAGRPERRQQLAEHRRVALGRVDDDGVGPA
jgi:hypothetical protein